MILDSDQLHIVELALGNSRDLVSREIHEFWPFFPFFRVREFGNPGNLANFRVHVSREMKKSGKMQALAQSNNCVFEYSVWHGIVRFLHEAVILMFLDHIFWIYKEY